MPYSRILIHLVWTSKKRHPFLTKQNKEIILNHIKDNAIKKKIFIELINGHSNHLHCLLSLGVDQKLSEIVKLIKGESSFWINQQKLTIRKFGWQNDFYAKSVSPRNYNQLRNYINNQEAHHRKVTFAEEYDKLIEDLGLKKIP